MTRAKSLERLAALVERLRRECPWDREQTPDTIKTFLLEECHETLEAIDSGDAGRLRGELGDLLFQIFFLSTLAAEKGWFRLEEVTDGIVDKMVERHPHVFGDTQAKTAADVLRNWEIIKKEERAKAGAAAKEKPTESYLEGVPRTLPARGRARFPEKRGRSHRGCRPDGSECALRRFPAA